MFQYILYIILLTPGNWSYPDGRFVLLVTLGLESVNKRAHIHHCLPEKVTKEMTSEGLHIAAEVEELVSENFIVGWIFRSLTFLK